MSELQNLESEKCDSSQKNPSEKNQNKVSVIIPTFNSLETIKDTIDSVLEQNYHDVEVIIVNDGSTDDTVRQLQVYSGKVTIITQKNAGQASARNNGGRHANGEFLAFLDADDLWDKTKITEQVKLLQQFPSALATYCDHRTIDGKGDLIGNSGALDHLRPSGDVLVALLYGSCIITPGVSLIRKKAWDLVGGFNEQSELRGTEDYDFWLRLSLKGAIIYSSQTLVSYRRHQQQATRQQGYDLRLTKAHLLSLNSIEVEIQKKNDKKLLNYFNDFHFKILIDAAWAARQTHSKKQAIKFGWQSCLKKWYSFSAWKALIRGGISFLKI